MYFYKQGNYADEPDQTKANYTRAQHYLQPLAMYKREDVLNALAVIKVQLK
jgi:hypothetical protein